MNRGTRVQWIIGAAVALCGWGYLTGMLWLTGTLMSLDEEWTGWGDLLLNPVIGPIYLAITIGVGVVCWNAIRRAFWA